MPKILALETSSDACSIALFQGDLPDLLIKENTLHAPREHTQRLLPMIERLLAECDIELKALDAIAYGCGPGSFTGLRICLSVAQGLAYGADLPLLSISSLQSLAATVARLEEAVKEDSVLVSAVDARMNEIYWCAYQQQDGQVQPLLPEQVSHAGDCRQWLQQHQQEHGVEVCVAGSGASQVIAREVMDSEVMDANVILFPEACASAYDVASLSLDLFKQQQFISPLEAEPRYVRNEVSWKKRERIRQAKN